MIKDIVSASTLVEFMLKAQKHPAKVVYPDIGSANKIAMNLSKDIEDGLRELRENQQPLGAEFEKVLYNNLHELYES